MPEVAWDDIHVPIQEGSPPSVNAGIDEEVPLDGVKSLEAKPPGAQPSIEQEAGEFFPGFRGGDYKPSDAKRQLLVVAKRSHTPSNKEMVLVDPTVGDYVDGRTAARKRKERGSKIREVAKKMYQDQRKNRERYSKAEDIVQNATVEEKRFPDKRLSIALKIVARGAPIDKKEAMRRAELQLMQRASL